MKVSGETIGLGAVPQKRIPPTEIAGYAVLPLLLIAMGAMPSTALFMLPLVVPLLYLTYRRFGAYFPIACVACYALFSLVFNYDILTVVYCCFLLFFVCGTILSTQFKQYLLCAAVALIAAIVGALCGAGIVRLAEGPLADVAEQYVRAEYDDPFIAFIADGTYAQAELPDDIGKLDRTDDGYYAAANEYLAALAEENAETAVPYYCVHFAGILAALGYFTSVLVNRKTMSPYDADATEDGLKRSTRCLGGAVRERVAFSQMRLPRAYLWAVLLPAFLCALVLDLVGGFEMLAACIMHAFITLPTAFCFITLCAYFCTLFTNAKARTAARGVFGLIAVLMFVVPFALLILSIVGVCDVILDLRFWTEYIRN